MSIHKYFCRTDCEYYPCHDLLEINCLFCYCPLYDLPDCGGDYKILKNNLKDCSQCLLPHKIENFEYIIMRYINDGAEEKQPGNKYDSPIDNCRSY